jgi:hypothetical protein
MGKKHCVSSKVTAVIKIGQLDFIVVFDIPKE